jgi:hypothetical protein
MSRLRFYPLLLLAPLACGDDVTPAEPAPIVAEEDASRFITGTVLSTTELLGDDGNRYPLIGPRTALLRELLGARIRLHGSPDEDGSNVLWIVTSLASPRSQASWSITSENGSG